MSNAIEISPTLTVQGFDPSSMDQKEIETYFSTFGEVASCELKKPAGTDFTAKFSKGYAMIKFFTIDGYTKALQMSTHTIGSQSVTVSASSGNAFMGYQKSLYYGKK